jgi:hypothetical protein
MPSQFSLPLDPTVVQSVGQQTGLAVSTVGTLGTPLILTDPAYKQANTGTVLAQAAFNYANTLTLGAAVDAFARSNTYYLSGVDATQNTNISIVTALAQAAFDSANNVAPKIQPAFNQANTGTVLAQASFDYANSRQNIQSSASPTFNGLTLTNALAVSQGGTGATSASSALTTLLPSGTTSGYVLTTGGPGTFYWATGGGGGSGATPGTTINSSRLSYTANGSGFSYTTPTYTPGASQLRVYFDGLRQFASEYTETSNTICTFSSTPASGVVVLFEVDGYVNNPYYANTVAFTAPFGSIVSTANTIQLAIQDLESRKAPLASPALSGTPTAPTPSIATSNTQIATTAFVRSILPSGVILMWSGSIATIPSGWFICDGTNSTPDLRDRFIVGAGTTYAVAATGGSKDAVIVTHTHTATSTVTDPGHTHGLWSDSDSAGSAGGGPRPYRQEYVRAGMITSSTTGVTVGTSITSTGVSGTNANLPPYYALAYIMKS